MATDPGTDAVRRKLERLARQIPNEGGRALYQEAQIERTESMRRTPVEYGALKGSHELEGPEIKGRDIEVTILVGGSAAPYCIYVHEDMEAIHEVGQSKFLESVILESKPYMGQRVAKRIHLNRMVA